MKRLYIPFFLFILCICAGTISAGDRLYTVEVELRKNTESLAFDRFSRFYIFKSKEACEKNSNFNNQPWRPYTRASVQELKASAMSFAKVVVNDSTELSYCEPGIIKDNNTIVFMLRNKSHGIVSGKRAVIVIGNSEALNTVIQGPRGAYSGNTPKNALIQWFSKLKNILADHNRLLIPISLLIIQKDSSITEVLRSEDLDHLPIDGNRSISDWIEANIVFAAPSPVGYNPIHNLGFIESFLGKKNIASVLYITEPENRKEDDIMGGDMGTLLYWKHELNIPIGIVTTNNCELWKKLDSRSNSLCLILGKDIATAEDFIELFDRWFQIYQ